MVWTVYRPNQMWTIGLPEIAIASLLNGYVSWVWLVVRLFYTQCSYWNVCSDTVRRYLTNVNVSSFRCTTFLKKHVSENVSEVQITTCNSMLTGLIGDAMSDEKWNSSIMYHAPEVVCFDSATDWSRFCSGNEGYCQHLRSTGNFQTVLVSCLSNNQII